MADDKGKIADSVLPVESEEDSLGKANTNESLNSPEVQEEHFKQNILMDVNEFPDDDGAKKEIPIDQREQDFEDLSKEASSQDAQANPIVDESAIYSAERGSFGRSATTTQAD